MSLQQRVQDLAKRTSESTVGVATCSAIIVAVVLLAVRPAFVLRRTEREDDPPKVALGRVAAWVLVCFIIVLVRDHVVTLYHDTLKPLGRHAVDLWGRILPRR